MSSSDERPTESLARTILRAATLGVLVGLSLEVALRCARVHAYSPSTPDVRWWRVESIHSVSPLLALGVALVVVSAVAWRLVARAREERGRLASLGLPRVLIVAAVRGGASGALVGVLGAISMTLTGDDLGIAQGALTVGVGAAAVTIVEALAARRPASWRRDAVACAAAFAAVLIAGFVARAHAAYVPTLLATGSFPAALETVEETVRRSTGSLSIFSPFAVACALLLLGRSRRLTLPAQTALVALGGSAAVLLTLEPMRLDVTVSNPAGLEAEALVRLMSAFLAPHVLKVLYVDLLVVLVVPLGAWVGDAVVERAPRSTEDAVPAPLAALAA